MRIIIAAALLLSGCGLSPEWNAWQQQRIAAAHERSAAQFDEQQAKLDAEWAYRSSPEGQAEQVCGYRARAAVAGRDRRLLVDLEGEAIAAQLYRDCLSIYQSTGRAP